MSIPVTCPHCEADLSVHDSLAGKETKCPHCGGAFDVPTVSMIEELSGDEIVEAEEVDEVIDVVELVEDVGLTAKAKTANNDDSILLQSRKSEEDTDEIGEISFPAKQLPTDDMDMTPMVDVTFLLLIFFMITASFSSEKAFEEPPPLPTDAVSTQPKQNSDSVRVQIDEFNAYTIIFSGGDEREASSKQELLIALDEAKNEIATGSKDKDDELKLLIEAHVDCIHGAVIAAVDAARDRGFNGFQVQVVEEFQ
jgi:biopolymer transport protein ExbD